MKRYSECNWLIRRYRDLRFVVPEILRAYWYIAKWSYYGKRHREYGEPYSLMSDDEYVNHVYTIHVATGQIRAGDYLTGEEYLRKVWDNV
jgi:hypothetical protein